jgi:hypothetical protein
MVFKIRFSGLRQEQGNEVRLQNRPRWVSLHDRSESARSIGGVLVSTDGLQTGWHVEEDPLASLIIGSKQINADSSQELALAA